MLPFLPLKKLQPKASKYLTWSVICLLLYAGGWIGFWKYDRANLPPLVAEGEERNGWRRTKIIEFGLPRGQWSDWVDSTGDGETTQVLPLEVQRLAKVEAKFDDGSTAVLAGNQPTDRKIVSARVWNGALARVTVQFFTWEKIDA